MAISGLIIYKSVLYQHFTFSSLRVGMQYDVKDLTIKIWNRIIN